MRARLRKARQALAAVVKALRENRPGIWYQRLRDARRKRNAVKRRKRADQRFREEAKQELDALIKRGADDTARAAQLQAEIDSATRRIRTRHSRQIKKTGRVRRFLRKATRRGRRENRLEDRADRIRARIRKIERELAQATWPQSVRVAELLYHDPPHLHFATPERAKLVEIAEIGQQAGLRIGEFPPFDPVEPVHVHGSWHYRDSANPYVVRSFAGRGDGLAFDGNDADGGSDKEVAFYWQLRQRYG